MTNDTIRRALEDAKAISKGEVEYERCDIVQARFDFEGLHDLAHGSPLTRTLPNLKAVLRELARLHRQGWWECADIEVLHRIAKRRETTLDVAIAACPEWRAAFLADYGIPYEEIEHD